MAGNEIDLLMTLDPLDYREEDIQKIVAYQRKLRGMYDAGIKPEKQSIDTVQGSALLDKLKMVKPVTLSDRRM